MRFAGTAALGALALLCAAPAQALTISNSDPKPHKITVIAGGVHVTALPEEALDKNIDVVVIGEGEATFVEFLRAFPDLLNGGLEKRHEILGRLPGLAFLDRGTMPRTAPRPRIPEMMARPSKRKTPPGKGSPGTQQSRPKAIRPPKKRPRAPQSFLHFPHGADPKTAQLGLKIPQKCPPC